MALNSITSTSINTRRSHHYLNSQLPRLLSFPLHTTQHTTTISNHFYLNQENRILTKNPNYLSGNEYPQIHPRPMSIHHDSPTPLSRKTLVQHRQLLQLSLLNQPNNPLHNRKTLPRTPEARFLQRIPPTKQFSSPRLPRRIRGHHPPIRSTNRTTTSTSR